MRKTKRLTKNIPILLVIVIAFFVFSGFAMLLAQNLSEHEILFNRHIPTLDNDFAGNRVIVTLRQDYSDVNKTIDVERFRVAISDGSAINSIEDLTYMTNPSAITRRESFSQILSIELRENCKKNVLRVIYELEKLDKVLAVEPDYNIKKCC